MLPMAVGSSPRPTVTSDPASALETIVETSHLAPRESLDSNGACRTVDPHPRTHYDIVDPLGTEGPRLEAEPTGSSGLQPEWDGSACERARACIGAIPSCTVHAVCAPACIPPRPALESNSASTETEPNR
jgi:hypothetical protein